MSEIISLFLVVMLNSPFAAYYSCQFMLEASGFNQAKRNGLKVLVHVSLGTFGVGAGFSEKRM